MSEPDPSITTDQNVVRPIRAAPLVLILWIAVVAIVGGYASGWSLHWFGVLGGASSVLLGLIAGLVSRRVLGYGGWSPGVILAAACLVAATLGQISFIHWNDVEGRRSWGKAVELLPVVLREDVSAAVALLAFALIGALTALVAALRKPKVRD